MNGDATTDREDEPGSGVLELPGLGAIALAWSARGLVAIDQTSLDIEARLAAIAPELGARREVPARYAEPLVAFARGEPVDLASVPVELRGTAFQERVWAALRRVPRGAVRTYAGLAADAGSPRGMRAVGMAMARNPLPLVVPCHRVVGNGLTLGGYTGGLARKRALLALEGVRVEGDRVLPGQLGLLG